VFALGAVSNSSSYLVLLQEAIGSACQEGELNGVCPPLASMQVVFDPSSQLAATSHAPESEGVTSMYNIHVACTNVLIMLGALQPYKSLLWWSRASWR
jgi:hypothetical protein